MHPEQPSSAACPSGAALSHSVFLGAAEVERMHAPLPGEHHLHCHVIQVGKRPVHFIKTTSLTGSLIVESDMSGNVLGLCEQRINNDFFGGVQSPAGGPV
jgi:hypothetical protein